MKVIEIVLGAIEIVLGGVVVVMLRKVWREWDLLSQASQGANRRWADVNILWHAQVEYGEQLRRLCRAVQLAAGRTIMQDPRVESALIAADETLRTVIEASARQLDTPAADSVRS